VPSREPGAPAERDIVAEARAAAGADDGEEGLEGAAAKAAARAASLGLAAASTGYASLGGVDDHVSGRGFLHPSLLYIFVFTHHIYVEFLTESTYGT